VIGRVDALVGATDIDALDDRAAVDLFRDVTALLQTGAAGGGALAG
jgi:hypothetical protein